MTGTAAAGLAGCVGGGPGGGGGGGNGGGGGGGNTSNGSGNATAGDGSYPDYSGQTLTVATWAGIYAETFEKSVARLFEERTGATVEVVPAGGSIISEIKSAPADNPPYDVAAAEGFFYWQGRNEELFLPIRKENIPNLEQVYPYLKEIRGTEYGVPADGSLEGIIYRSDLGWTPKTWKDLLSDEQGTDRIGFEGAWYIYPFEVAAVSLDAVDGIGELYEEQHHERIFERMRQFAEGVELWTGSFAEIQSSLRQQIIDMSMWYSGMGNAAASQRGNLEFSTPDNTAGYLDHYCPVRGTDNRGMAEDFLDHMLAADVQTEWSNTAYVYVTNPEASYPEQVRDQYPQSSEDWKNVAIADFTQIEEYSSKFSKEFQEIQN
jgi:spermidine/putrescine transport system substrate-binding protein